ncbi:hypothetical protein E8E14_012791 [Neopestalotiopsis sp. 37M]|nr:hypothetical protein E8E14_012791 [Neopestalotiopsis sp. 37M]
MFTRHALRQAGGQFAGHPRFAIYMFDRIHRQWVPVTSDVHVASAQNARTTVEDIKKAIKGMPIEGRALLSQLCRDFTGHPLVTRDISNFIQTLRIEKLNGYTATQAFVNKLTDNGLRHKVVFADEGHNRVEAVIWTYP